MIALKAILGLSSVRMKIEKLPVKTLGDVATCLKIHLLIVNLFKHLIFGQAVKRPSILGANKANFTVIRSKLVDC